MKFAEKLLLLRTQNGYSQELLSEKLNVSRQAISKWELGITLPETDKLISISRLFNVSIDSLLIDSIGLNSSNSMESVVLKFLSSVRDMDELSKELVDITCDGIIDENEKVQMQKIIETLDSVARDIEEIKKKINVYDQQ
ncbi:MAG: helix-turn-helix domain-containing protein [Lachnospiraceae bacterium]